jgi:hypothetical protein
MKNIFFVESPLSYLNVLEFKYSRAISCNSSILILTTIWEVNLLQILPIIDKQEWEEIIILNFNLNTSWTKITPIFKTGKFIQFLSFWKQLKKVNKLVHTYSKVNCVVSGYYTNEIVLHFCSKIKYLEFILVDDGTMTISTNQTRLSEFKYKFKNTLINNGRIKPDFKLFFKYVIGLKDTGISQITFFTVYDLHQNKFDNYEYNNYSLLKKNVSKKNKNDKIYFLGSPLSESLPSAIDVVNFELIIKKVILLYGAENIVYFAHRNETLQVINKLKLIYGFNIKLLKVPFEYFLVNEEIMPYKIVSFFSSALFNLSIILPESILIESIVIPEDKLLDNFNLKNIKETYLKIASNKRINLIQLSGL